MSTPRRRQRLPNIVLFGIDSLRRDHMSLYGYHRLTDLDFARIAKLGKSRHLTVYLEHGEIADYIGAY